MDICPSRPTGFQRSIFQLYLYSGTEFMLLLVYIIVFCHTTCKMSFSYQLVVITRVVGYGASDYLFKVLVPEEYLGAVLGDLSLRRAAIVKILPQEDMKLIIADVPLACLMVRLLLWSIIPPVISTIGLLHDDQNCYLWTGLTFCSLLSLWCIKQ